MTVWLKGSIKVLMFICTICVTFCWIHALIYLEYYNNLLASLIGGISAIAFGIYLFKIQEGWTWFKR
jgi:hypothetical protein